MTLDISGGSPTLNTAHTHTCQHCGTGFDSPMNRRKFCTDRCRRDAYEARNSGPCMRCGTKCKSVKNMMCAPCALAFKREQKLDRDMKLIAKIRELWDQGLPYRDIAHQIGWDVNSLNVKVVRLRQLYGPDVLPYRYDAWRVQKSKTQSHLLRSERQ